MLVIFSCTENWNDHYNTETFDLPDKTLKTIIGNDPDLSKFYQMLQMSGYTSVIDASQSYTIWAPQNNALPGIDLSDKKLVKEIVENHIARNRYTTSDGQDMAVRMLNGKYITLQAGTNGTSFGTTQVTRQNIPATNGLLHVINGYAPFLSNLWEFLDRSENLDSIRTFLYGKQIKIFDVENSPVIGYNSENNAVYDSTFIISNEILDIIGHIDYEDSAYTAIIPDNTAWNEAYKRIESYFNFPSNAGSANRERKYTTITLLRDVLFKGRIDDPTTHDSLVSTTGNIYYNPASLFENTSKSVHSNGIAYVTSQMPFEDTISFFKEIRFEAENSTGVEEANSDLYLRNSYGTGFNVSKKQYILVDPASTSTSPSVTFSIPNTLSASYNLYCVFVPASIVNESDLTPYKVMFKLTSINSSNGAISVTDISPSKNTTNTNSLTKMFVKKVDFQFANIKDEDYNDVSVKLEVINIATDNEDNNKIYSRSMRIDCIILEPVL